MTKTTKITIFITQSAIICLAILALILFALPYAARDLLGSPYISIYREFRNNPLNLISFILPLVILLIGNSLLFIDKMAKKCLLPIVITNAMCSLFLVVVFAFLVFLTGSVMPAPRINATGYIIFTNKMILFLLVIFHGVVVIKNKQTKKQTNQKTNKPKNNKLSPKEKFYNGNNKKKIVSQTDSSTKYSADGDADSSIGGFGV